MGSGARAVAAAGTVLTLVALVLPWAEVVGARGTAEVDGWGNGAEVLAGLALVMAAGAARRDARLVAAAGAPAAAWLLLVGYQLPGELLADTAGAWQAEFSLGWTSASPEPFCAWARRLQGPAANATPLAWRPPRWRGRRWVPPRSRSERRAPLHSAPH